MREAKVWRVEFFETDDAALAAAKARIP